MLPDAKFSPSKQRHLPDGFGMESTDDDKRVGRHQMELQGSAEEKIEVFRQREIIKVLLLYVLACLLFVMLMPLEAVPV